MPSVYPTDMLTGGILTWFGMFGAENASSDALQCICDLSMCCCCNYSFWLSFRRSTAMFDACVFIYFWQVVSWHDLACLLWHVLACLFCQVVYWHVLANGCVLFTWTLLTGAILSSRQDTTRSCKNPEKKDAGLAGFEMQENDVCHILNARQRHGARATCALQYHTFFPSADSICWDLFGLFQRTFSTSLDLFLLPVHGIKLDDNPHLTTPTQHVMVGITRSKVIFFYTFPKLLGDFHFVHDPTYWQKLS